MYIAQTNSTNTHLKSHPKEEYVYTAFQTSGRGQAGNGWESEEGKNVLLSVRLHLDHILATQQWQVCVAVSVALWTVVAEYVENRSKLCIKWPNDLYYEDKKVAGVLIENTLCGDLLSESIVGIGLNVNQMQWCSAPNPISIKQISGKENRVEELVEKLVQNLRNIGIISANCVNLYREHLYRRKGFFWWEEREVSVVPTMNGHCTAQSFEAEIADITPCGEIILRTKTGEEKRYHFKQIKYIL